MLVANPKDKNKKGLCCAYGCTNKRYKGSRMCLKHINKTRLFVEPEKVCYNNLKGNAKKRGKSFSLTFEEFLSFLEMNPDYLSKKGKGVKNLQIDRIDNSKGYSLDNIRSITTKENLWKRDNIDYTGDCGVFGEIEEDLPF